MSKLPAGVVWPAFVVGILSVSLTVCAITVVAATSDPSYAVESEYYEKAVSWDESARLRAASDALGWTADVAVTAPEHGARALEVTVRLRDGSGAEGAAVRALAFHHARRGDARELTLEPVGGGVYRGSLGPGRAGLWQVRLRVDRGPDTFVLTSDVRTPDRPGSG